MTSGCEQIETIVKKKQWIFPDQIAVWAARFSTLEVALGACPFAHWLIALAALADVPSRRVVRAAAYVAQSCGVSTAASDEPAVAATLDNLLAWDSSAGKEPWQALPFVRFGDSGFVISSPAHEAARLVVIEIARAARTFTEEGGPCLDLVSGVVNAAIVQSGMASALPARQSSLVEAAVCARVGLTNVGPAMINPEAPPIPDEPTLPVARVVDALAAAAALARRRLFDES